MEPRPGSSARSVTPSRRGGAVDLRDVELPGQDVRIAQIQADSHVARWAFGALIATVVLGAISMTIVDVSGRPVDPIRELFLAAVTGEIGLIAGLRRP